MVDRIRIHRVIGKLSEGVTREVAERAIETLRTHARENRLKLPVGRKTFRTLEEAASSYLEKIDQDPKHGKNIQRKKMHIERLISHFGKIRIDRIDASSINSYWRLRRDAGLSVATINRELSTLSHFLNRCVEWRWIAAKPKIHKGEEARKKIVVLDHTAIAALLQAARQDIDPHIWLFTAIAAGTGMRHSEILKMQWKDIDFDRSRIFVPFAKSGPRHQPVPKRLMQTLRTEWAKGDKPSEHLFPALRKDAKFPFRQSMAEPFRRVVRAAGLDPKKISPHILRHTAITALVQSGIDIPTIQQISGHKTPQMVYRYTHIADHHVSQAVDTLDSIFPPDHYTKNTQTEGRGPRS